MVSTHIDASDEVLSSWHWTDYISHYRYWALALGLLFLHLTGFLFNNTQYQFFYTAVDGGDNILDILFLLNIFAGIMGIAFVLYAVRKRLKSTLLWTSIVTALSILAFFFSGDLFVVIPAILAVLIRFCLTVFWATLVVILIQGRSNIKSLSVIALSTHITSYMTAQYLLYQANKFELYDILEEPWQKCLIIIPLVITIILIAFANGKFFSVAPVKTITPIQGPRRSPVLVAILSAFIPFYYYYFVATRPRELKAIDSDIKTPTGGGMIAMIIFATLLAPVWYAHTRKKLKENHPHNALLQNRSHKFIGVISFFFPAIAAAMVQSDMNAIETNRDPFAS